MKCLNTNITEFHLFKRIDPQTLADHAHLYQVSAYLMILVILDAPSAGSRKYERNPKF